jgi:sRNA-binding protein
MMAKEDNTRDAHAYANEALERRIVRTEGGDLTAYIAITLEEAQAQAEALEAEEAQAKEEAAKKETRNRKAKERRLFPAPKDPNAPPPKERAMKAERFLTVADLHTPRDTPFLRVAGKWLAQAGFPVNARVKIKVAKGCLIITRELAAA